MFIMDEGLDLLFHDIARLAGYQPYQSPEAVLRSAHQRLQHDTRDVAAIHVIAAARLRHGQPDRCLHLLQLHAEALEHDATGHQLAGYAYLANDHVATAHAHLYAAVRLDPRKHDCWTLLGRIDEQRGLINQAADFYQRAIYFEDSRHEAAIALSRLYARTDRLRRAIATIRIALKGDRRSAKLNSVLAAMLIRRAGVMHRRRKTKVELAVLRRAVACYQTSIAAQPSAKTFIALGRLQQRLGNFTESAAAFAQAAQIDKQNAVAITCLANSAVDNGDIDEGLKLYRKALDISPEFAPAHFKFSRTQRFKQEKPTLQYVTRLQELASDHQRRPRELVQLNFALAKVLDDLGQYDRAWEHYDRANRLKPGHSSPLTEATRSSNKRKPLLDFADSAIEFFTPEWFASKRGVGNPSTTPVFIVGMPRSGTTLTEQILSSHPSVVGAGELKDIERIRHQLAGCDAGQPADKYPGCLDRVSNQVLTELADAHVAMLDQMKDAQRLVTDKMPTNFMHLGLIAALFPGATIIHCRRNPMDVLVSCYCQNLSPPFCDLEALAQYHRQYRRLMNHWENVLPLKIHSFDYEAMVADPETNSRRLIQCCNLPWDPSCLSFHANSRAVHTPSKWQVRQPMYRTSVGKWKRFESQLAPIVQLVGQDHEADGCTNSFHSSVA